MTAQSMTPSQTPVSLSPLTQKNAERAEIEAQLQKWLSSGKKIEKVPANVVKGYPVNFTESEKGIDDDDA